VSGEQNAIREVPLRLSARVTTKGGVIDPAARIVWSFGDGSASEGSVVEKTYRYAGTYLVVVTASDGDAFVRDETLVTVQSSQVRVVRVSGEGVTLINESSERLDLSGWRLATDTSSFRFPSGTLLLPSIETLFPNAITNLPSSLEISLLYPNGMIAARYAPPVSVTEQPPVPIESYIPVREVEPIISQKAKAEPYEEAVPAPAPISQEGTGAGALSVQNDTLAAVGTAGAAKTPAAGLFHSVWTLGLLGIMTLAAGAFILL
jgi:hypothetical protein